ncbi:hypothetical protein AGMMS49592_1580 [Endomicrobiia bacterium]|nr:hypothetical protein AGMMS49592_1530 [Endomicrobiia bacterium]GHT33285.1 hypothetical protein AGMMS49592_1580 [Endomicrobiia bacterium]GHT51801.1 hypothetical protein AGMMS49990_06890 [Endomicrobiia bacterium]
MTEARPKLKLFININKLWFKHAVRVGEKDYAETLIGKDMDRDDESICICIRFLDGRKNNTVWFGEHGLKKVTSDLIEQVSRHLDYVMIAHAKREHEKGEDIDMHKEVCDMYVSSPVSRFLYDGKAYAHKYLHAFKERLKMFCNKRRL